MALNPQGVQVALGFKEGLKFYFLLDDDFRISHYENIK